MAEDSLVTVLMIAVLGMGLLFLALAFFYALLSGMGRVLRDRAAPPAAVSPQAPGHSGDEEARLQAAAVAVALARAGLPPPHSGSPALLAGGQEGAGTASAWWSLHHQQRLASGTCRERRR